VSSAHMWLRHHRMCGCEGRLVRVGTERATPTQHAPAPARRPRCNAEQRAANAATQKRRDSSAARAAGGGLWDAAVAACSVRAAAWRVVLWLRACFCCYRENAHAFLAGPRAKAGWPLTQPRPLSLRLDFVAPPSLCSSITLARPHSPGPLSNMHKISNLTGSARHGWEKMAPSAGFGFSRNHEMPVQAPLKRPTTANAPPPVIQPGSQVNLSFNIPFNSNLAGPEVDEILYASPGATARWSAEESAGDVPVHKLPVHTQNVDNLRALCRDITEQTDNRVAATVVSAESKPLPGLQRGPLRALVTNVCLSGELELVNQMRCKILNSTPISLVRCGHRVLPCTS